MTLSISVVSPGGIWMSADFRLTDTATGQPRPYDSPKIVPLSYLEPIWQGLISYAGVGSSANLETSEWIGRVLEGNPCLGLSDLVDVLRREGDVWLNQVPLRLRAHTFNVAAFVDGSAHFAIVTNVDHLDGTSGSVSSRLYVEQDVISGGAHVFVTGIPGSIDRADRQELAAMACRESPERTEIPTTLGRLNRAAASDPRFGDFISRGCITAELLPDGTGRSFIHEPTSDLIPTSVLGGRTMGPELILHAIEVMGRTRAFVHLVDVPAHQAQAAADCLSEVGIEVVRIGIDTSSEELKVHPDQLEAARIALRQSLPDSDPAA